MLPVRKEGGSSTLGTRALYALYASDQEAVAAEQRIVEGLGAAEKFTDPDFGGNSALYCDWTRPPFGSLPADSVQWGRICDLGVRDMIQPVFAASASQPALVGGEHGRRPQRQRQLLQGALPNTWVVNAMAAISTKEELLESVFVSRKNWLRGIFTLRFFKSGQYVYVHVDDRIPLDRDRRPLYCRSEDPNEFWPLVLEKAYAKLHWNYENLSFGTLNYAIGDFTGRSAVDYDLVVQHPDNQAAAGGGGGGGGGTRRPHSFHVFKQIALDLAAGAVVAATYQPQPGNVLRKLEGVLIGQAYVVEEVAFFEPGHTGTNPKGGGSVRVEGVADMVPSETSVHLVRLRSAWGALENADTNHLSDDEPAPSDDLGFANASNGPKSESKESKVQDQDATTPSGAVPSSSWIGPWSVSHRQTWDLYPEIEAALKPLDTARKTGGCSFWMSWADFVRLFNRATSAPNLAAKSVKIFRGAWAQSTPRSGAGGCPLFHSFPSNPQFCFTTKHETALTITLRQPDGRFVAGRREYSNGIGLLVAGLDVLGPDARRLLEYDPTKCDIRFGTEMFRRQRDITVSVTVDPGRYVIVPMTYRPQQQAFVLEISFDTILDWEHDNDSDEPLPQREASSSNSSEEAGESSGRRRMSVHGEVNLADRRWVLEEQQRFDIEDTGRPLQNLHREVAFLVKELGDVREEMRRMDSQIQALNAERGY